MTTPSSPAPSPHARFVRLVDAHFAGRGSPAVERQLRPHLVDCAACREHYDRHLQLAAVDPGAALPARDRLARGLGIATAAPAGRWWQLTAPLAAAALAAVLLVVWRFPSETMQPRGVGPTGPGSQVLVYEVPGDGLPRLAVSAIHRGSGLAFAYANIGKRARLSVFGVDDRRRVYWYHPAWTDPADDPVGVPIATDDAIHEISQVIYHRLEGQNLQLFGVFADRPLSVRQLEAAVARAPLDRQGRLQIELPGTEVARVDLALVDRS